MKKALGLVTKRNGPAAQEITLIGDGSVCRFTPTDIPPVVSEDLVVVTLTDDGNHGLIKNKSLANLPPTTDSHTRNLTVKACNVQRATENLLKEIPETDKKKINLSITTNQLGNRMIEYSYQNETERFNAKSERDQAIESSLRLFPPDPVVKKTPFKASTLYASYLDTTDRIDKTNKALNESVAGSINRGQTASNLSFQENLDSKHSNGIDKNVENIQQLLDKAADPKVEEPHTINKILNDVTEIGETDWSEIFESEPEYLAPPIPFRETEDEVSMRESLGYTRIGYAVLDVPPEDIVFGNKSQVEMMPLLRAAGSIAKGFGHTEQSITMRFIMPDGPSINNSLLPLIRMVEHTPFLPIENDLLNNTYDIDAIAIYGLQVATVPNYPNMLEVTLQAEKFDWQQYIQGCPSFDSSFCYPLFMKWCDSKTNTLGLEPSLETRKTQFTGDLRFYIPTEEYLQAMTTVEELYRPIDIIKKRIADAQTIASMYDYLNGKSTGYSALNLPVTEGDSAGGIFDGSLLELPEETYMEEKTVVVGPGTLADPAERSREVTVTTKSVKEKGVIVKVTSPHWLQLLHTQGAIKNVYSGTSRNLNDVYYSSETGLRYKKDKHGKLEITNAKLTDSELETLWKDLDAVAVPMGQSVLGRTGASTTTADQNTLFRLSHAVYWVEVDLKEVNDNKGAFNILKKGVETYAKKGEGEDKLKEATNRYQTKLKEMEDIKYESIEIEGLIPEQINAGMAPKIVKHETQGNEVGAMQCMGTGDVVFTISGSLESDEAAKKLKQMMEKLTYLVRTYQGKGIGTDTGYPGYLRISNELAAILGIDSLLPINCSIQTQPGFPGEHKFELAFVKFENENNSRENLKPMDDPNWYGNTMEGLQRTTDDPSNHAIRAEQLHSKLRTLELYPDMKLPTYKELFVWMQTMMEQGYDERWTAQEIREYLLPSITDKEGRLTYNAANAYVDPDFYCSPWVSFGKKLIDELSWDDAGKKNKTKITSNLIDATKAKATLDFNGKWKPDEKCQAQIGYYEEEYKKIKADMESSTSNVSKDIETAANSIGLQAKDLNEVIKQRGVPEGPAKVMLSIEGGASTVVNGTHNNNIGLGQLGNSALSTALKYSGKYNFVESGSGGTYTKGSSRLSYSTKSGYSSKSEVDPNDPRLDPLMAADLSLAYLTMKRDMVWEAAGRRIPKDSDECWIMAMAAYNCGDTRVKRIITDNLSNTATEQSLLEAVRSQVPNETKNYIDKAKGLLKTKETKEETLIPVNYGRSPFGFKEGHVDVTTSVPQMALAKRQEEKLRKTPKPEMPGAKMFPIDEMFLREDGLDMLYDMRNYSNVGRLVRAFPTYCLLLVDEGRWLRFWRLYDKFYGMNAVQSIEIHKTRKGPIDTAVIGFSNIFGRLSGLPVENPMVPGINYKWGLDYIIEGIIQGLFPSPSDYLEQWSMHANRLLLRPGARVHIRIGYGSNSNRLPVVFNGTITEQPAQEENLTVVALSDGRELTNVMSEGSYKSHSILGCAMEPREIINKVMSPIGLVELVTKGGYRHDNPYGISHFGSVSYATMDKHTQEIGVNIYRADPQGMESDVANAESSLWTRLDVLGLCRGFSTESLIGIKMDEATPWKVIDTCAKVTMDYVAAVHPFELRSTLFYGRPYWPVYYEYRADILAASRKAMTSEMKGLVKNPEDIDISKFPEKLMYWKPFSQFHIISSEHNLIANKIRTNAEVYTGCMAGGTSNSWFTTDNHQYWTEPWFLDTDIFPEYQRMMYIKSGLYSTQTQDVIEGIEQWDIARFIGWTTRKPDNNYAVGSLKTALKDMYDGHLVIMGDPSIKPYDRIYLSDTHIDMHGTIEVKEVTHHLSSEFGLVSTVSPDIMASATDAQDQLGIAWYGQLGRKIAGGMALRGLVTSYAVQLNQEALGKALLTLLIKIDAKGSQELKTLGLSVKDAIYKATMGNLKEIYKGSKSYESMEKLLFKIQAKGSKAVDVVDEWFTKLIADGKIGEVLKTYVSNEKNLSSLSEFLSKHESIADVWDFVANFWDRLETSLENTRIGRLVAKHGKEIETLATQKNEISKLKSVAENIKKDIDTLDKERIAKKKKITTLKTQKKIDETKKEAKSLYNKARYRQKKLDDVTKTIQEQEEALAANESTAAKLYRLQQTGRDVEPARKAYTEANEAYLKASKKVETLRAKTLPKESKFQTMDVIDVARKQTATEAAEATVRASKTYKDMMTAQEVLEGASTKLKEVEEVYAMSAQAIRGGTIKWLGNIRRGSITKMLTKAGIWFAVANSIADWIGRYLIRRQCIILFPLSFKGRKLVAGIDGHMGCVVGDHQGYWDSIISQFSLNQGMMEGWSRAQESYGLGGIFTKDFLKGAVAFTLFGVGVDVPEYEFDINYEEASGLPGGEVAAAKMLGPQRPAAPRLGTYTSGKKEVGMFTTTLDKRLDGRNWVEGDCGDYVTQLLKVMGAKDKSGKLIDVGDSRITAASDRCYKKWYPSANELEPGDIIALDYRTSKQHFAMVCRNSEGDLYLNECLNGNVQISRTLQSQASRISWYARPNY